MDKQQRLDYWLDPKGTNQKTLDGMGLSLIGLSISNPALVCFGSANTFTINNLPSGANISWSVPNTFNTLNQSNNSITISPTSSDPFAAEISANIFLNGNLLTTIAKSFNVNTYNFIISGPAVILALQSGSYSTGVSPNSCTPPATGVNYEWRINGALVETSPNITIQSVQGSSLPLLSNVDSKNKVALNSDSMTINQQIDPPIYIELSVTLKTSSGKVIGSTSMQVTIYGDYKVVSKALSPALPISTNVYPNPTSDILNVEIDRNVIAQPQATQQTEITHEVRLYDVHGKLLLHTKTKDSHIHLNVSHLHNGNYYLHIYDGVSDKPAIHQVVVSH